MRSSIVLMAMFAASLAGAAGNYSEERELTLDASGIDKLTIDAGAGAIEVTGEQGRSDILVMATIELPGRDGDEAREVLEEDLILTLERHGGYAALRAEFDNMSWRFGDSPRVHLDVRMPASLDLGVDDGSGSIEVSTVNGDVEVEDGSGSIRLTDLGGQVVVDDGSGSITADGVGGDISIDDGSGSIEVSRVAGSVIIDDGSGGIDVRDVAQDLVIIEDGSGGIDYEDVRGTVSIDG